MSKEEFFKGTSAPRCPELMRILRDLEYVEQTGIGITKIVEVYGKEAFDISDNFITVTLPFDEEVNQLDSSFFFFFEDMTENENIILEYIQKNGSINKKQVAEILNVSGSSATRYLSALVKKNVLRKEGGSRDIKYFSTH